MAVLCSFDEKSILKNNETNEIDRIIIDLVEEHEADLLPVLSRQGEGNLQQGEDAAGVVVGGVPAGGAVQEPPDKETAQGNGRKGHQHQKRRRLQRHDDSDQDSLRHRHHKKQGDHQHQLIAQVEKEVPGRDEVGEREHGAGVVVGGEEDLRRLRAARDHVLGREAVFNMGCVSRRLQLLAEPGAECLLLGPGLADLEVRQDPPGNWRHHLFSPLLLTAASNGRRR